MTFFYDTIVADAASARETADGYLVAKARVARTGVQDYLGAELGRPDLPIVKVYRPPEAVFGRDAMASYAHRPMTNDHPSAPVTSATWKDVAVGQTGGDVVRDGEFVQVPLVLMDAGAIADFRAGKRELSMGYMAEIVFEDGTAPDGTPYQAVQRSMTMNHLALVDRARGGEFLRIGDKRTPGGIIPAHQPTEGGHHMADTKQVLVDGLTVTTTEQGAQAIEKLQRQVADAATAHAAALADRDAKLAKAEAERDDAKAKVLTDAQIDQRVQERADLITKAQTVHDGADYAGKSPAEIRRTAVVAKLGDAAVSGKSNDYIEARFDILVGDAAANKDPVRQHLRTSDGKPAPTDNGWSEMVARTESAWKGK